MDTTEAIAELQRVTYKPGWTFRFEDYGTGTVTVFYECWVDNSTPRHIDPRPQVLTDGAMLLHVQDVRSAPELHRLFLDKIHEEAELHETREFYRVDGVAPFHPHRIDGRARWDGRVRRMAGVY
jgi:hypothetical protein